MSQMLCLLLGRTQNQGCLHQFVWENKRINHIWDLVCQ